MKSFGKIAAAAAIGLAAVVAASTATARPRLSGEAELARLLEGRVPGRPVDCISLSDSREQRIIDRTAVVYGSGRTIYVNRPSNPRSLDESDVLVTRLHTPQLCRLDSVRLHDQSSRMFRGVLMLEQFVPYRRVEAARR